MAGNKWKLADAPVIRNQMKIAVANAAVSNGNFYLLGTQLSGVITIRE
jgi:hypothetical protein